MRPFSRGGSARGSGYRTPRSIRPCLSDKRTELSLFNLARYLFEVMSSDLISLSYNNKIRDCKLRNTHDASGSVGPGGRSRGRQCVRAHDVVT